MYLYIGWILEIINFVKFFFINIEIRLREIFCDLRLFSKLLAEFSLEVRWLICYFGFFLLFYIFIIFKIRVC